MPPPQVLAAHSASVLHAVKLMLLQEPIAHQVEGPSGAHCARALRNQAIDEREIGAHQGQAAIVGELMSHGDAASVVILISRPGLDVIRRPDRRWASLLGTELGAEYSRWPAIEKNIQDAGVQSCCELPLTTARRKLGTLIFAAALVFIGGAGLVWFLRATGLPVS